MIGLNWKDDNAAARRWLAELGNPYAAVAEDREGRVAIDWGVYGAPETFLIGAGRHGALQAHRADDARGLAIGVPAAHRSGTADRGAAARETAAPAAGALLACWCALGGACGHRQRARVRGSGAAGTLRANQSRAALPRLPSETIADSNAPLAADLRREVREMMQAGQTDAEIRQFMIERYGDFVLYRPRMNATNFLLWAAPVLLLLIGGGVAVRFIRRRTAEVDEDDAESGAGRA